MLGVVSHVLKSSIFRTLQAFSHAKQVSVSATSGHEAVVDVCEK